MSAATQWCHSLSHHVEVEVHSSGAFHLGKKGDFLAVWETFVPTPTDTLLGALPFADEMATATRHNLVKSDRNLTIHKAWWQPWAPQFYLSTGGYVEEETPPLGLDVLSPPSAGRLSCCQCLDKLFARQRPSIYSVCLLCCHLQPLWAPSSARHQPHNSTQHRLWLPQQPKSRHICEIWPAKDPFISTEEREIL